MSLLNNDYDRGKFEEYYSLYRQDMYRIAYSILHKVTSKNPYEKEEKSDIIRI